MRGPAPAQGAACAPSAGVSPGLVLLVLPSLPPPQHPPAPRKLRLRCLLDHASTRGSLETFACVSGAK